MHIDQQKEQFSRAYIKAVAAAAGFAWSQPSTDDESVDLSLSQAGGNGIRRSPRLDLQLKCTEKQPKSDEQFPFSIKMKNYDDLRETNLMVPRILVVVYVPKRREDWLHWTEKELTLRRCAYWVNLHGLPPSDNKSSQTVQIYKKQVFTVKQLSEMMERIGKGEKP